MCLTVPTADNHSKTTGHSKTANDDISSVINLKCDLRAILLPATHADRLVTYLKRVISSCTKQLSLRHLSLISISYIHEPKEDWRPHIYWIWVIRWTLYNSFACVRYFFIKNCICSSPRLWMVTDSQYWYTLILLCLGPCSSQIWSYELNWSVRWSQKGSQAQHTP